MEKKKKPDYVVFDETTQKYNANILPYATSLGAPSIQIEDISIWKKINVIKVNHQLKTKFEKLKEEYEAMMEQFEYNHLVYNSSYNFEPVVGEVYHLYKGEDENTFLSLIAPHECNFNHLGSFRLNFDRMWLKIEDPKK
jgi:hypothetical protein